MDARNLRGRKVYSASERAQRREAQRNASGKIDFFDPNYDEVKEEFGGKDPWTYFDRSNFKKERRARIREANVGKKKAWEKGAVHAVKEKSKEGATLNTID